MLVRAAGIEDIEILVETRMEVIKAVFKPSSEENLSHLEHASRCYYEQALLCGEHIACLVFDGEIFVGCGGLCLQHEMPIPKNIKGKTGFLMNIYVRKEYRRNHIGTQIVQWLIDRAKDHGVSKISLDASKDGMPLYKSFGFKMNDEYMELDIN